MDADITETQTNLMDPMQERKTNKKTEINLKKIEAFLSRTEEGKLIFNNTKQTK